MQEEILSLKSKINIDCEICDKCCVNRGDLKLTPINVLEIAKYLEIEPSEFIEKYTVKIDEKKPELLIKATGVNNRCIFNNGKTFKCMIQKQKPMQCVVFPLVPFNLDLDLFVNSNQCPMTAKKKMTVDRWLNGNNNIYKRHKQIYIKWIDFLNTIEPLWSTLDSDKKKAIWNEIYLNYDLKRNLITQVEDHLSKIISFSF